MISTEDYLWFVDQALDGMLAIASELGDDLVNAKPNLPGANSAYVILYHCLGVMNYWGGRIATGREIERDRDAEFTSTGTVGQITQLTREARKRLEADLANAEFEKPPRGTPSSTDAMLPLGRTQGGAFVHIYEELAQHRGQMELGRDVVLAR